MRDDQKLITIAEFENEFNAELAKVTLDNAGISCTVLGDDISAIKPYTTTSFNVELQVFEKDVERAKQILAEKHPLEGEDDETNDQKE